MGEPSKKTKNPYIQLPYQLMLNYSDLSKSM